MALKNKVVFQQLYSRFIISQDQSSNLDIHLESTHTLLQSGGLKAAVQELRNLRAAVVDTQTISREAQRSEGLGGQD